MARVIHQFVF